MYPKQILENLASFIIKIFIIFFTFIILVELLYFFIKNNYHNEQNNNVVSATPIVRKHAQQDLDSAISAERRLQVSRMIERPLFTEGRKQLPEAALGDIRSHLPRLSGIIINGVNRKAIFSAVNEKGLVVAEGSYVGEFLIENIDTDKVVVVGADGVKVLRPAFDFNAPLPYVAQARVPDAPLPDNHSFLLKVCQTELECQN